MQKQGREINGIKLYTVDEVAALLRINRLTVLKYIKRGRLKAQRIGKPLMITEQDLKAFLLGIAAERVQERVQDRVNAPEPAVLP